MGPKKKKRRVLLTEGTGGVGDEDRDAARGEELAEPRREADEKVDARREDERRDDEERQLGEGLARKVDGHAVHAGLVLLQEHGVLGAKHLRDEVRYKCDTDIMFARQSKYLPLHLSERRVCRCRLLLRT